MAKARFSLGAIDSIERLAVIDGVSYAYLENYISDILTVASAITFHRNGKHRRFYLDDNNLIQIRITREVQ